MIMRNLKRPALIAGLGLLALSGCAEPLASAPAATAEYAPNCSIAFTSEWDDTPGGATREEELLATLRLYESHAAKLPALEDVPADSERSPQDEDDPVIAYVVVRALNALLVALPDAERGVDDKAPLAVTATTESGAELASMVISPHGGGGYRISTLSAWGWTSDHPSCMSEEDYEDYLRNQQ